MDVEYVQVAIAVCDRVASQLAIEAGCSEDTALACLVRTFRQFIARVPRKGQPSEHNRIVGSNAARTIAMLAGWKKDPLVFLEACTRVEPPIFERLPDGWALNGLDRYDHLGKLKEGWRTRQERYRKVAALAKELMAQEKSLSKAEAKSRAQSIVASRESTRDITGDVTDKVTPTVTHSNTDVTRDITTPSRVSHAAKEKEKEKEEEKEKNLRDTTTNAAPAPVSGGRPGKPGVSVARAKARKRAKGLVVVAGGESGPEGGRTPDGGFADSWQGFWAYVVAERKKRDLSPEKPPRGFDDWYRRARLQADVWALSGAYVAFSADPNFGPEKGRAWPTAMFIADGVWLPRLGMLDLPEPNRRHL